MKPWHVAAHTQGRWAHSELTRSEDTDIDATCNDGTRCSGRVAYGIINGDRGVGWRITS